MVFSIVEKWSIPNIVEQRFLTSAASEKPTSAAMPAQHLNARGHVFRSASIRWFRNYNRPHYLSANNFEKIRPDKSPRSRLRIAVSGNGDRVDLGWGRLMRFGLSPSMYSNRRDGARAFEYRDIAAHRRRRSSQIPPHLLSAQTA